jgi:flavodoxin I
MEEPVMKTLVVYDSVFGNTEKIARAVAEGAGAEAVKVDAAGTDILNGVTLFVVGSPTRAFRATPAMQSFLKGLPAKRLTGVSVAAFDTRMIVEEVNNRILTVMVSIFGYAAKPIADSLVKKGGKLVLPPEGFFVKGSEGPLKDGELERAADWGRKVRDAAEKK